MTLELEPARNVHTFDQHGPFARTESFPDAVPAPASPLGDDADTTAAVCGQVAGTNCRRAAFQFGYRKPVERLCLDLVAKNPYPYVRGEAWHVLAKYSREPRSMTAADPRALTDRAVNIAKDKSQENFVERWGACHFLCVSEDVTGAHRSRWLKYQAPLLHSLLAPVLPDGAYAKGEAVEKFLGRSTPEPGLSVCSALHDRGLTPSTFGLTPAELPSQLANTLRELGVISAPGPRVDPIAEILKSRYGVPRGKSWHTLLAAEYVHALGLLKQAEAAFAGGRSFWLALRIPRMTDT